MIRSQGSRLPKWLILCFYLAFFFCRLSRENETWGRWERIYVGDAVIPKDTVLTTYRGELVIAEGRPTQSRTESKIEFLLWAFAFSTHPAFRSN